MVSHTKVWGEVDAKKAKSNASKTSRAVRTINDSREKTTLGDLEALSSLKDKMEAEAMRLNLIRGKKGNKLPI